MASRERRPRSRARHREQPAGILRRHSHGSGSVVDAETGTRFHLPHGALGQALDGDTVRLEVTRRSPGRPSEARVEAVVAVADRAFPGALQRVGRRAMVQVDGNLTGRPVYLHPGAVVDLAEGTRVLVAVTARHWGPTGLQGEVIEVLGDRDDARADAAAVTARYQLPVSFPSAVLAEAAAVARPVEPSAARLDLRQWACLTVDPDSAQDYDDAVSLAAREEGGWRLGVHIADVAHFVGPGSALDTEARSRGVSVYFLDQVLPMLPPVLSAGACTLAPGQDRLALSVLIDLNSAAEVTDYRVVETVIRSRARLTYDQVQAVFAAEPVAAGPAQAYADLLLEMRQLSRCRRRWRRLRGALEFELPEARVVLDGASRPTAVGEHPRLESQELIEEFMLLANECVGDYAARRRLPVLWRVHRGPDAGRLESVLTALSKTDGWPRGGWRVDDVRAVLAALTRRPGGAALHRVVLQAMMRAEYAAVDVGHFGLACRHYLHFTSPIRRYADLWVHRWVKQSLAGVPVAAIDAGEGDVAVLGRLVSALEQRAEQAERAYLRIKQLRFLAQVRDRVWPGTVTGLVRGACFVELAGLQVQGSCSVRLTQGRGGTRRRYAAGRGSGPEIGLGQQVRVRVARVDWTAADLDLVLVDTDGAAPTGRRRSARHSVAQRSASQANRLGPRRRPSDPDRAGAGRRRNRAKSRISRGNP